ncbi:MAG: hypothetical protein INQ03_17170 [Candidatus Heimdallarchaeota archaeon]|nr:hypothetical protein [Candidatus Heimdallarchaeota archaeon]
MRDNVILRMISTVLVNTIIFIIFGLLSFPYVNIGMIRIGLNIGILALAVIAIFNEPRISFAVGLIGSILLELFITGTVVSFGLVSLTYGILAYIISKPVYDYSSLATKVELLRIMKNTSFGFLVFIILHIIILLLIQNQNIQSAVLFAILPLFIPSFFALVFYSPVFAVLTGLIRSKTVTPSQLPTT